MIEFACFYLAAGFVVALAIDLWTTILPIATTYTQLTGGFKNEIFFWFFSAYFLWRYYEFEYDKN